MTLIIKINMVKGRRRNAEGNEDTRIEGKMEIRKIRKII